MVSEPFSDNYQKRIHKTKWSQILEKANAGLGRERERRRWHVEEWKKRNVSKSDKCQHHNDFKQRQKPPSHNILCSFPPSSSYKNVGPIFLLCFASYHTLLHFTIHTTLIDSLIHIHHLIPFFSKPFTLPSFQVLATFIIIILYPFI